MRKLLIVFLTACSFLFSGSLLADSSVLKERLVNGSPWTGTWSSGSHDGTTTIVFSVDSNGLLSGAVTKDSGDHSKSPLGPLRSITLKDETHVTFRGNGGFQYRLKLSGDSLKGAMSHGGYSSSLSLKSGI